MIGNQVGSRRQSAARACGVLLVAATIGAGAWWSPTVSAAPIADSVPRAGSPLAVAASGEAVPIAGGSDGGAVAGTTIAVLTSSQKPWNEPALPSSRVTFVDAATLRIRATATLPPAPVAVALSPDGALAYVAASNSIMVIDTASGAVLHSAAYPGLGMGGCFAMTMGSAMWGFPAQLALSPDGTRLSTIAVGCGRTSQLWTIDVSSLAVTGMALIYREAYKSLDIPEMLAATNANTLVSVSSFNEIDNETTYRLASMTVAAGTSSPPCTQTAPCVTGGTETDMPGTTLTPLALLGSGGLAIDPASGALVAPDGQSLLVLDAVTGKATSQIAGFFGQEVLVDRATRRAYGDDGSVADLAAGKALGSLPRSTIPEGGTAFAYDGGRGYAATKAGLWAFDAQGAKLLPTRVTQVSVKVTSIGTGTARATIRWTKPAAAGSSPITGYRVVAGGGQSCTTKQTTCTMTLGKPTSGKRYTFTVTALSKVGTGPPVTAKARATP
jgi:DNA-binding beta-propeller fold protein YncE